MRVGDLEIDTASRAVHLRGAPLDLSAKEFALLRTLAADPTRVFSKAELLRAIWGQRTVGSDADAGLARVPAAAQARGRRRAVRRQRVGRRLPARGRPCARRGARRRCMTRARRALLLGGLAVVLGSLAASDVAGREAALRRGAGPARPGGRHARRHRGRRADHGAGARGAAPARPLRPRDGVPRSRRGARRARGRRDPGRDRPAARAAGGRRGRRAGPARRAPGSGSRGSSRSAPRASCARDAHGRADHARRARRRGPYPAGAARGGGAQLGARAARGGGRSGRRSRGSRWRCG